MNTISPGTYECEIIEVKVRETLSGDHALHVHFQRVSDGRSAGWLNLTFSPSQRERSERILKVLKVTSAQQLLGKRALVTVAIESKAGFPVRNIIPIGGVQELKA